MRKLTALMVLLMIVIGCTESKEIQMVKNGELKMCEGVTLDEMAKGFLSSPKWASGTSKEGVKFVNVSGGISYQQKDVKATIQFEINKDSTSFKFRAFEMNDVPQPDLIAMSLMQKMCNNVIEESMQYDKSAQSDVRNAKTCVEAYFAENSKYPDNFEQTGCKATAGIRMDYKKIGDKYTISAYHDKGRRKFTTASDIFTIENGKR